MRKRQNEEMALIFDQLLDEDDRAFILSVARKRVARKAKRPPLLRVVAGATTTPGRDLLGNLG
jgi:hypothetical protein